MSKTASTIIDALGGTAATARMCRVRAPSVSGWRHRGIPLARWMYLHAVRPDVVPPPALPSATAGSTATDAPARSEAA